MPYYVVCFDITDDRARASVGKRLLRHGERVQESVFEVRLGSVQDLEALAAELRAMLDDDDNLRFYRLCLDCRKASCDVHGQPVATFPAVVII